MVPPPSQLFVVRNVANLVPPYKPDGEMHGVSAALEFGVKVRTGLLLRLWRYLTCCQCAIREVLQH
mgnify:CR=1 FL=1